MISTVITSLLHLLVCWTLVFIVGLSHEGAALSVAISYWVNVVILAIYIQFSNELGAGQPHAAKLTAKIVIFLAVTEGLLVSLISIAARSTWGYLYTHEEEVVRYLASIMPLLAVSNFMDGIQAVLSG